MKLIGLTGGIGTGKSTVSRILLDLGHPVIDADILAREVVSPGSFGLKGLAQVFGRDILLYGKLGIELDRAKLREKIFADATARLVLENITHPLIQWRAQQEFLKLRESGAPVAFYDAALIFEKNLVGQFDCVIVAHTPQDIQIKRLMVRDKIDHAMALKRTEAQWDLDKKKSAAHFVIDNSGSVDETKKQVIELLEKLK